jgi:hypothetical protein
MSPSARGLTLGFGATQFFGPHDPHPCLNLLRRCISSCLPDEGDQKKSALLCKNLDAKAEPKAAECSLKHDLNQASLEVIS